MSSLDDVRKKFSDVLIARVSVQNYRIKVKGDDKLTSFLGC
jgi:hypothetical protein